MTSIVYLQNKQNKINISSHKNQVEAKAYE